MPRYSAPYALMMSRSVRFISSVPALGFAVRKVGGAFGRDHRLRDAQPDDAVDLRAVPAVLDGDLVAEESRRSGAGMGNERLVLVEFQLEVIAQELGQVGLDLLGLGLRPGEPEEVIVRLCRPVDYAGIE